MWQGDPKYLHFDVHEWYQYLKYWGDFLMFCCSDYTFVGMKDIDLENDITMESFGFGEGKLL